MSYAIDRQKTFDLVVGSAEYARFAAPGSGNAARTVPASKVGTEQPTQVRIASLMPQSDSDEDPVPLVTLSRVPAGMLRLVSWRLHKTLVYQPVGPNPIGVTTKP